MRLEVHIRNEVFQVSAPPHRQVRWLIEAARIWAQQTSQKRLQAGQCAARRANGDPLIETEALEGCLREGESVYVYLPEDLSFISLGR